jgi:CheY-like chemotaxis protein
MKILLVEDHAAVAEISGSQLRELHDHEVFHVSDGAAALAALPGFRPDLVLLDLHLPDMTGYEVAAKIRASGEWDAVILVAVTGFGSEIDPERAAEMGIDAHFRKPMNFDALPHIRRRSV